MRRISTTKGVPLLFVPFPNGHMAEENKMSMIEKEFAVDVRYSEPDNEAVMVSADYGLDSAADRIIAAIREVYGATVVTTTGCTPHLPTFEVGLKIFAERQQRAFEALQRWRTTDTRDWPWDEAYDLDHWMICNLRDCFVMNEWLRQEAGTRENMTRVQEARHPAVELVIAEKGLVRTALLRKLRVHPQLLALYYDDDIVYG